MKLNYFSESGYDDLFDSVPLNTECYGKLNNEDWIKKHFGNRAYMKESRIDVALPILDANNDDYINTVLIHSAFKDKITPKQASNPYLWSYLSHCQYWKYTFERWSKEGMSVNTIKQRFFCNTHEGNRIGFLRNSISRLWWAGYMTYQEDNPGDPYVLTKLMFSNSDISASILERKFSMNKEITIGILRAIKRINDDPDLEDVGKSPKTGEYEWRELCKYINRYGAVSLLDALTRDDIERMSYEYILMQRISI